MIALLRRIIAKAALCTDRASEETMGASGDLFDLHRSRNDCGGILAAQKLRHRREDHHQVRESPHCEAVGRSSRRLSLRQFAFSEWDVKQHSIWNFNINVVASLPVPCCHFCGEDRSGELYGVSRCHRLEGGEDFVSRGNTQ